MFVCLCVCHTPVLYRNGRCTDWAVLAYRLPSTYSTDSIGATRCSSVEAIESGATAAATAAIDIATASSSISQQPEPSAPSVNDLTDQPIQLDQRLAQQLRDQFQLLPQTQVQYNPQSPQPTVPIDAQAQPVIQPAAQQIDAQIDGSYRKQYMKQWIAFVVTSLLHRLFTY